MKRVKIFESIDESQFTQEQKQSIEDFVSNYQGYFKDEDVHNFAYKIGLDKHEVEEYVYELARKGLRNQPIDTIKGGDGDNTNSDVFDQEEFQVGCLVEFEHTDNPSLAKEIATDHLSRVSDYYHRLISAGLVDEEDALNLAKSFGWKI